MTKNAFILNFFTFYNIMWRLALPVLKKNQRLADGFSARATGSGLEKADLWIQAASAGEARLAVKILSLLCPEKPIRILVTTITRQGLDILATELPPGSYSRAVTLQTAWFPFDRPDIIQQVVKQVSPRVLVLLETELWPALLHYSKLARIPVLLLNARLSTGSYTAYAHTRFFWRHLCPARIMATTSEDAQRYRRIFPTARTGVMPNIKFDGVRPPAPDAGPAGENPRNSRLASLIDTRAPFTVFASVRRQEEDQVIHILKTITRQFPAQTIGLFPRHLHRIPAWKKKLSRAGLAWELKSAITAYQVSFKIILWDRFGELDQAYSFASCAFVGGSLAPLGGQNFIEPLVQGVPVVTGPWLDDFKWVNPGIFDLGIAFRRQDWESVAQTMTDILRAPLPGHVIRQRALAYIDKHRGGTRLACEEIVNALHQ